MRDMVSLCLINDSMVAYFAIFQMQCAYFFGNQYRKSTVNTLEHGVQDVLPMAIFYNIANERIRYLIITYKQNYFFPTFSSSPAENSPSNTSFI